jgi:chromosome partitioning protein
MRRISILNFKGGTGKTSVAENLGHALARAGATVFVVDGDRQSNTTTTLLGKRVSPSLGDVIRGDVQLTDAIYEARENLYVIPSDGDLDKVAVKLRENHRFYYTLQKSLEALEGQVDFVFFDQAGAFTPVMDALLIASTEMLIPCELEPYAVQGLFDMFNKLKQELGQELKNTGIIPYNTDMSKKMTGAYLQELINTFDDLVLDPVRTDTSVPYAQSEGLTVFEYAERHKVKSRAAEDFARLARDLMGGKQK